VGHCGDVAPRLIVKEQPAIGQRSMEQAGCRDWLEIVLKNPGNF
jgi:hypothetical protein